jgi:hypothetical protein
MALTISSPSGLVDCDCSGGNTVCVKGSGAIRNGQVAKAVRAKIYIPPDQPNPVTPPPAGTTSTVPDASGNWTIGMLGGGVCSSAAPYTDCRIWVWAEYDNSSSASSSSSSSSSSSGGLIYETASQLFQGKCATNIPPC